jgi:hypothetical protein
MRFIVQYCSSWDGGRQELQAASAFIQEVFDDAEITAREIDAYPNEVTIFAVEESGPVEIIRVPQRDLYRKYKWPAKDRILKALQGMSA